MDKRLPLEVVVVREADWREEKGKVVLLVSRFGPGIMGRILRRVFGNLVLRLRLDDMGSHVWKLCDGSRSLKEIKASLEENFSDTSDRAHERLDRFLRDLERQGWASFLMPKEG
jgi:hypothetical protein